MPWLQSRVMVTTSLQDHGCLLGRKTSIQKLTNTKTNKGGRVRMGPRPLRPEKIDGLLVLPVKTSMLHTGHLISLLVNHSGLSLSRKSGLI